MFESLPDGFANSGAFADHLREATTRLYGTPLQKMLRALVATRANNADRFQKTVLARIREFENELGVAGTKFGKSRASSAFGLLYVAGSFAKAKGVIPASWDCRAACLAGYRNYQAQLPDQTPLLARLKTIASLPTTLDLRAAPLPALSDADVEQHGAFLVLGIRDRVELLMTTAMCKERFPDWKTLSKETEFRALNHRDPEHKTKQRQVRRGNPKERYVCFILPHDLVPATGAQR